MGFLTRLLAGLTAAAALGAGLTGTANAVDVTGATGNTKSVVKLAADDTNNLPDHIVNGNFEYPVKSDMPVNDGNFWYISQNDGSYFANGTVLGKRYKLPEGFDKAKFAWHSTQTGDTYYPDLERADDVQVDYTADGTNHYSEISAAQSGATIYQDVATVPGVMYKWSLKHASLDSSHLDKMSVIIGEPGKETAQEATRTTANGHGDKLGKVGTVISTKVSNPEMPAGNKFQEGAHTGQWETYTGTYIATGTVTRFAFRSVEGYSAWDGNLLDDISFSKAYKLTYDKNASDATGSVPSDTTANTVKQAKADATGTVKTVTDTKTKTSGTVKTVADTNASLPDHLVNGDFNVNYHDQWKDSFGGWTSIDPNAGKTLHATSLPNGSSWKWTAINGWDKSKFGWTSTQKAGSNVQQKANAVELQYDDSTADNVYAELCAYEAGTAIYQDIRTVPGTLYKVRLKHASLNSTYLDKMQVMIGTPGHEQPVEMTRTTVNGHGDKLNEKSTTIATKVTNSNNRHHADQWETYEGTYLIPDGQTTTRFTFKSIDAKQLDYGNVLDDIVFDKAYRLSYDKNASDATGKVPSNQRGKENTVQPAKSKTTGTVKTVVDTSDGLPTELVNGDFEYPGADVLSQNLRDKKRNWWGVSRKDKMVYESDNPTKWVSLPSTFDSDRFAWDSSEAGKTSGVQEGSSQWHTNEVELQRDSRTGNMYAELSPYQAQSSIRQYIRTTPGALYKVRLKHASLSSEYLDKMQVLIGADGNEQPVRMTRVESQNGLDAIGESTASTTISTHASNKAEISWGSGLGYHSSRNHDGQWATYEGVYVATSDVTVFTFKSVDSPSFNTGNLLDDVVFTKAYKLTYDKNSADASGQVPSNQRGKENTTQPAKDKTSGSVKLVADDDVAEYAANGLPRQIVNSDFDHDWRNIVSQSKMSAKYNFANIDPAHGDVEISGALNSKGEASKQWVHLNGFDASQFGWKSNQTDTRVDGRGGIVEIQRSRANDNMYAEITASQANTYLYQDIDTAHDYPTVYTVKLRYAHRNGTINSNEKIQILVGAPGHEQPVEMTRIASDRGNKVGEKSTTVNAPNTDGWLGSWDTFQGSVVVPAGQDISRFTFKALGSIDGISGNLIDDVQFKLAYKLSYDKNANDAYGQVPSDTTANTVKQAKTRTTGSVRTVAGRTDGKVSDLVQRTTTHEDGSVTVKTIDTSTDVVSGCQVYYPAGQKITLATMAKDDDCWDSSMLSRPGHTQLGWNQDRNATQAQAEVTMVEGGMAVYAVWVGNPVLTYDTNKPATWSGQMPSTPASVSVAYNTAAADGSGWRAGDTTKIRGYRFLGWYTGPQDNTGLYQWATPLTGNVTVYAHWQRLQANVVYNANGGTGSHPNTTGWQYSDVTIPGDTSKSFKRDKYVFKGWGTKPGKADVVYKDGSKVALQDKDITLYAQWQEVHENFVETGGIGLPIAIAGGVLLLMFGIGSTVMLTRRMNGHGMPDDE